MQPLDAAGDPAPRPWLLQCAPLFVPDRGEVLQWAPAGSKPGGVLAFDVAAGRWVADPAGGPPLEMPGGERPGMLTVSNGVCWDAKCKQVIYTLPGLMAAYDPQTRKWRDMKPQTVFEGFESPAILADHFYERAALVLRSRQPGPPPCYGLGTCYDPLNDEILLFPHFGAANLDRVAVDGRTSGHYGTMVYSFRDNTWPASGQHPGAPETRRARKALLEVMAKISRAGDAAWARQEMDATSPEDICVDLAMAHAALAEAARKRSGEGGACQGDAGAMGSVPVPGGRRLGRGPGGRRPHSVGLRRNPRHGPPHRAARTLRHPAGLRPQAPGDRDVRRAQRSCAA